MDFTTKYLKYKNKYINLKNKLIDNRIYDLEGNIVLQPQSLIIKTGIHLQKTLLGSIIGNLSTSYCNKFNTTDDAVNRIDKFAKNYKIQPSSIINCQDVSNPIECWKRFATPNDFFIRQRTGLPNGPSKNIVVSPADCYCIYLDAQNTNVWIKGTNFTPHNLIFGKLTNSSFDNYSLFVFRLAPHHYHRYHCPINGKLLSVTKLGKERLSVDPIIVNSKKDVYSQNVRLILTIQLTNKLLAYLAIIGATCVSSIELTNHKIVKAFQEKYNINKLKDTEINNLIDNLIDFSDKNVQLENNEELGNFQYGGSTLVLIYPKDNVTFTEIGEIIKKNSNQVYDDLNNPKCPPIETEIKVGDGLYRIL
jgi:phosphatidylserine decarboxylase precursor